MRLPRWLSLALSTALLVSACAPAPTAPPAGGAAKPAAPAAGQPAAAGAVRKEGPSLTFKLASPSPEADLSGLGVKHWANLVDQRTGGRIKFQFFWAGSLVNSTQMFDGVRDGLADFAVPAMSYVSGRVADVALFEVPFAYATDERLMLPYYREVEPILNDIFSKDFNQRVVWASPSTTASPISCRDKFLTNQQAWQGTLVRVAGKWQSATLEKWGGKPVVIDLGDAYTALQRGTADCLLLVWNLLDSFKLYEVVKYMTRIDHSVNLQAITANLDAWKKLPPEDQKILIDAGYETQEWVMDQRRTLVVDAIEKFKKEGVKICTPPQEEMLRLRKASDEVQLEIAKTQTEQGKKIRDITAKYNAQVEKWGPTQGDMTPCA